MLKIYGLTGTNRVKKTEQESNLCFNCSIKKNPSLSRFRSRCWNYRRVRYFRTANLHEGSHIYMFIS